MTKMEKEFPWCAVIGVVLAVICHTIVLKGNLQTSSALQDVASSTSGWSKVGLGIARSFRDELDVKMDNVTSSLTMALQQIAQVQDLLDGIISAVGNQTDNITDEVQASLLQISSGQPTLSENVSEVEEAIDKAIMGAINETNTKIKETFDKGRDIVVEKAAELTKPALKILIMTKVKELVNKLMGVLTEKLDEFMVKITPALERVGEWLVKFGDKILAALEGFSGTLDSVQKIFDQVMSQLSPGKPEGIAEIMVHDTFTLFDMSDTGSINLQDLLDVRETYSLDPLQGNMPKDLIEKYDTDGDKALDEAEFTLASSDPDIPGVLALVLRAFSKRLAEIAGQVGRATMRDQLSEKVVGYLQLICSKNKTKMSWVSDMLTNGTLPVEFTADIMGQLALAVDDPDVLTKADVGQMVVGEMLHLHPEGTLKAFDRLTNETFWAEEGFDPLDFAAVVQRVTKWITQAKKENSLVQTDEEEMIQLALNQMISEMPAMAHERSKQNLAKYFTKRRQNMKQRHKALFSSKSSKYILHHMSGSQAASDPLVAATPAEKAVRAGMPAKPETLEFAKWLSWNASNTAARFQKQCFDDSSKSSAALDSFSQQIQGLVKKVTGFLQMMQKYSDPDYLQEMVMNTTVSIKDDLIKVVEKLIDSAIEAVNNKVVPAIEKAIDKVEDKVMGVVEGVEGVVVKGVEANFTKAVEKGEEALKTAKATAKKVKEGVDTVTAVVTAVDPQAVKTGVTKVAADATSKATAAVSSAVDVVIEHTDAVIAGATQAVSSAVKAVTTQAGKLGIGALQQKTNLGQHVKHLDTRTSSYSDLHFTSAEMAQIEADALLGAELDGGLETLILQLQSLNNMLPQATTMIKESRTAVSAAAQQMDSVFNVFGEKGPPLFMDISELWKMVWILYYFFFGPLTIMLLFYAFWASGYFGGPHKVEDPEELPPSPSFMDRCRICYESCCMCCCNFHDTAMCFWSGILLMQVVVLLIFVLSVTLSICGGVQMFMVAGCAQVYMLNDPQICEQTLDMFKGFLATFHIERFDEVLTNACDNHGLLTCRDMSNKMQSAVLMTSVFSFLAALASFQMILEASVLHERACCRRRLEYLFQKE